MGAKKSFVLVVALLLPVAFFFFLKFYGKNEFVVKPLYQEGKIETASFCQLHVEAPYHLPDSIYNALIATNGLIPTDSFVVLAFPRNEEEKRSLEKQSRRFKSAFGDHPVAWQWALSTRNSGKKGADRIKQCFLLMDQEQSVALLDNKRRIRGQYKSSREDIDRLIMEMKIMLKKY